MRVVGVEQLAAAFRALPDRPRVVVGGNLAHPGVLVDALDATVDRYTLFVLNARTPLPVRDGVHVETPFHGPATRRHPSCAYLPMRLSLVPRLFATSRPPDAVLVQTSCPRDGVVSLGAEVNVLPAAIEAVRARGGLVVAQLNPRMPHVLGDGVLDVGLVDLGIDGEVALAAPAAAQVDAAAEAIAARVVTLAEDGGTLQAGIGRVPDEVLARLRARRGLGVWSELVGDGVMALERAGALDEGRPIVGSFLLGSEELLAWADGNPRLRLLRTEVVNDPATIASQPGMLSVNAALEVDLHDQANASHVRGSAYSGLGGQPDFVAGALHARGGHAVLVLPSWHDRAACSTIVPALAAPTTSFQHSVVVTEHGAAHLFGRDEHEQASALATIADPRCRPELLDAASRIGRR